MGLPANTVRSRLARARETLRALLPDQGDLFDAGDDSIMVRDGDYRAVEDYRR